MATYQANFYYRVRNNTNSDITLYKAAEAIRKIQFPLMGESKSKPVQPGPTTGIQSGEIDVQTAQKRPLSRPAQFEDAPLPTNNAVVGELDEENRTQDNQKKGLEAHHEKNENRSAEIVTVIQKGSFKTLTGTVVDMIDQDQLKPYLDYNAISIEELNIFPDTNYTLQNETAKKISIRSKKYEDLIIPPFGSRALSSEILKDYDFVDWQRQNLISLHGETPANNTGLVLMGLSVIAYGLFVLVSVPLAIFYRNSISWGTIGIVTLVFVVLVGISMYFSERKTGEIKSLASLWEWLKLSPGVALVLASGVGLPTFVVYFFGDGQRLLASAEHSLPVLGRLMQLSFISIASLLPALLYYLFGRQQVEKQKNNFYREVMTLDPNVESLSEACTKYDPLLDSVYGDGNSPFAILLLVISTTLLVMGWVITLSPIGSIPADSINLIDFFTPTKTPFTFGFLGVYFFTLNMIFRRYVRSDLTPKTYAYIIVRLLITLVLVWTVSILPTFSSDSFLETGLLAVAFVIGIFPETGLTLVQDVVRKLFANSKIPGEDRDGLSLTSLEGINLYDRARFIEEGIENIENLAHHNLVELIARTRIPTPRLVDMFDQSILYLHFNPEKEENKQVWTQFAMLGIRTATDLQESIEYWDKNVTVPDDENPTLPVARMKMVLETFKDDEWYEYIQNWRRMTSSNWEVVVTNPYVFYTNRSENNQPADLAKNI